jgi:hypothetical protein
MSYSLSPIFNGQHFNNQGKPLAGGRAYFYVAGSFSTLQSIYSSSVGDTELANPVVLDASGRTPAIFLDNTLSYNAALTLADGTTVLQRYESFKAPAVEA